MKVYSYSCQGESHKRENNKACQDSSLHYYDSEKGIAVCIVSDGHGGSRYFRSATGSKLLVDITLEKILGFVDGLSSLGSSILGNPFMQFGISEKRDLTNERKQQLNTYFTQLFTAIKSEWLIAIYKDADEVDLSEWELQYVQEKYRKEFIDRTNLEKHYGATLMAFVKMPKYWFAFHLGDGKMIMFDENGEILEPVLWDDDCFLNMTTSICSSDAIEKFRYTFESDGAFPLAVFLGSDGLDDSYGDGEQLHNFYTSLLQYILLEGESALKEQLMLNLPIISAKGSQDDMSVAYYINDDNLKEAVNTITVKQIKNAEKELQHTLEAADSHKEKQIKLATEKSQITEQIELETAKYEGQKTQIEREENEINELQQQVAELQGKINARKASVLENRKALQTYPKSISRKKKELQSVEANLHYAEKDAEEAEKAAEAIRKKISKLQGLLDEQEN